MPKAHIAFAKDVAGNISAASEFFATQRSEHFCVACGRPLTRRVGPRNYPHFVHEEAVKCAKAAHLALRAAAQRVLAEARFLRVPVPVAANLEGSKAGVHSQGILLQWATSASDVNVVQVPVDFLADTQIGQLALRLSIPGLNASEPTKAAPLPEIPLLQVNLPAPELVHGFADLRQALLHDVATKSWISQPVVKTPGHAGPPEVLLAAEESGDSAAVGVDSKPWHRAIAFADSAIYRQLTPSRQLEVLERLMNLPRQTWPPEVDIEVDNEDVFGTDRRIWQADVFARFIHAATPRARSSDFSADAVLQWVEARYPTTPSFPGAALFALKTYLSELIARGILGYRDIHTGIYAVLRRATDEQEPLIWAMHPNLSASQLRVLANRVGMHIPVGMVQVLLDSFDNSHPAGTVSEFVSIISRLLHAPPRLVKALLLDAGLVQEVETTGVQGVQQDLF